MLGKEDSDRRLKNPGKVDLINLAIYAGIDYDEKRFIDAYSRHFKDVLDYFRDRREDLLIINICKGQGWERLCNFLNEPVPVREFPEVFKTRYNQKKKICLIIPYFGRFPNWFPFYLKSCAYNPDLNILIFSDATPPESYPKNVRFINFSIEDFNRLASKKLGMDITIKNSYKICDYKPSYGLIFEDFAKGYEYWGYSDIDIIFGDVMSFLRPETGKYDIITSRKDFLTGHFTIYKNNGSNKHLFKKIKGYENELKKPDCVRTDEISMDAVVKELQEKEKIKVLFKDFMRSDATEIDKDWKIFFSRGSVIYEGDGLMYFHFLLSKKNSDFIIPQLKNLPDEFYIDKKGFHVLD